MLVRNLFFAAILTPLAADVEQAHGRFVVSNVDVFDGFHLLRNQLVTVEGGMIREMAPAKGEPTGQTLLPGLIDAHVHISGEESLEQAAALGVTTELDMWGDPKTLVPLERAIERGEFPNAADFRTSATGVTVPGGHPTEFGVPMAVLKPGDDVQKFVDTRFQEGSDYLKIMYEHAFPTLTEQQLRDVVAAAHRRNRLAVAHEGVQAEGLAEMKAGVDGVEHIFADSPISAEFVRIAKATHMVFTPTLTVVAAACGRPTGEALANDERFAPYLLAWNIKILKSRFPEKQTAGTHYEYAVRAVRALHDAGLPILAGTDSPNPSTGYGASLHQELTLLVECGLSNEEVLRAATSEPAKQFGLIDRGRIEPGRRADLLLVRGNPVENIAATRDIVKIWKAGVEIDRKAVARKIAAQSR
ncbi:MAG: amidohydrolase family protein [Acidobacteriota bacterium]|nr:amidohydrolase family protein [Acidobacteriota bacterium]